MSKQVFKPADVRTVINEFKRKNEMFKVVGYLGEPSGVPMLLNSGLFYGYPEGQMNTCMEITRERFRKMHFIFHIDLYICYHDKTYTRTSYQEVGYLNDVYRDTRDKALLALDKIRREFLEPDEDEFNFSTSEDGVMPTGYYFEMKLVRFGITDTPEKELMKTMLGYSLFNSDITDKHYTSELFELKARENGLKHFV